MEKEIKDLKNDNIEIKINMENLEKENIQIKERITEIKNENSKLKDKLKSKNKIINDLKEQNIEMNLNHLIEVEKLKKDIQNIKYHESSRIIIENYIHKYRDILSEKMNMKEKSFKILEKLEGQEKYYYNQILQHYYEFNEVKNI